jgi:RNA polymerase sigma factor (sigma-70 family)
MNAGQKIIPDQEILAMLGDRKTEQDGIRYLYQHHFETLGWYVVNNNGSWEDAQDNFQEVLVSFVHLVQQGKFREESSIRTFLYSMNRNIWLNELKRRGRSEEREKKFELYKDETDPSIEKTVENREASQQLIRVMETLGDNCKKILMLFYYENYSMKEMLSELNYENEQVVRNKKYKCLKKLEELITSEKGLYHQLKNLLNG